MKKIKKTKIRTYALYGAIVLVSVIAVGSISYAYTSLGNGSPKVVVEGNYIEAQELPEQNLGALTSPDVESLYMCVNRDCTYHITADFINASTTIVSFLNPFGDDGTSTLEMIRLDIKTAATSSATFACGASANAYATPTYSLLSSDSLATSTIGTIENNIATTYNQGAGGGSVAKIMLTPGLPYVVCKATTAYAGAFTETTNTFAGQFTARISQTLR
jgi:hypothetical protein